MMKKYKRKLTTYLIITIVSMAVAVKFSLDEDIDNVGLVILYASGIIALVFWSMFMIGTRNANYYMRKYATDVTEPEMNIQKFGNGIYFNGEYFELMNFRGEEVACRGFYINGYSVDKPKNYIGRCKLAVIDHHPVSNEPFRFEQNAVYYIDEDGVSYIVKDTQNKLDPGSIGHIETLYEQYLYKDDFCKMLMDLVKEMSDAAP